MNSSSIAANEAAQKLQAAKDAAKRAIQGQNYEAMLQALQEKDRLEKLVTTGVVTSNLNFQKKLKLAAELAAKKAAELAAKKAAELAAKKAATFIGPEKGFQFQAEKKMKDTSIRHYLIKVTKSGVLTAYVWAQGGSPITENRLPLIVKRLLVNSVPAAIERLGLESESVAKLDSKEYREKELRYLESLTLPSLRELLGLNLTSVEVEKLKELVVAYQKIGSRNSAVFAAHVRELIKSRS